MTNSQMEGHNNPPEMIELAASTASSISAWMADNPVVATEENARDAKLQIDRAKLCIKDLEAERDRRTRPLIDRLLTVREEYRGPRRLIGTILDEMLYRLQIFVRAEERKLAIRAEEAAAKTLEAERAARDAEKIEQEKLDDASEGEVGIDVAEVTSNADQAFEDYQKAARQAVLAQRETHVKIGGGFSRAIGLRKKETLHVVDCFAAIGELGVTTDIALAILKSARTFRKLNGRLPNGVARTVEDNL
jgi:hypothetical protein